MTNNITILGAYGTKAKGFGTSSFYLNSKNVIDAGNLLNGLGEQCIEIENIWLTHSHLDHICDIAYILDNYFTARKQTLNIIGLPDTIKAMKKYFLNDVIWPDFSNIKMINSSFMALKYIEIEIGNKYSIGDNEFIEAYETDHSVPSCGYIYGNIDSSILITADTYSLKSTVEILENNLSISTLIVECSFPSRLENLAIESKHLTPKILLKELKTLKRDNIRIYINHLKPLFIDEIKDEIMNNFGIKGIKIVKDGEILNF